MTRRVDEGFAQTVQKHMRGFLRSGVTGCAFAAAHAQDVVGGAVAQFVHVGPLDDDLAGDLELSFDASAASRAAAMVVLPELRTPDEICTMLALLRDRDRWRVERPAWRRHPRPDVLVGLWWRTAGGDWTSVMGLAPFGTMPATRRAPYVALVAWTGGRENEHWTKGKPGKVGLVDMRLPTEMTPQAYDGAFASTQANAKALKAALAEGAAEPDVAFCLPAEHEAAIWA